MTRVLHSDQVKEEMGRCGCPPLVTSVSGDKWWKGGCVQGVQFGKGFSCKFWIAMKPRWEGRYVCVTFILQSFGMLQGYSGVLTTWIYRFSVTTKILPNCTPVPHL